MRHHKIELKKFQFLDLGYHVAIHKWAIILKIGLVCHMEISYLRKVLVKSFTSFRWKTTLTFW
jgi:hypothetical protein